MSEFAKLNILIVPCTEWLEGSQQRLHHFAEEWSRNHNVHVLYVERPSNFGCREKRDLRSLNMTIHKIHTIRTHDLSLFYILNSMLQFFSILQIILTSCINVIVIEGLGTSSFAVLAARILNKTVVYDYSDYYPGFISFYGDSGLRIRLIEALGRLSDFLNLKFSSATVAVSDGLVQRCSSYSKRVFKVSNGVSSEIFGSAKPRNYGDTKENTILGFVGTIDSWVSLETVIDAIHNLNFNLHTKTSLLVIGNGPRMTSVIEYANKCKVIDKVKFVGWIPYVHLPEHFERMDICVLPFDRSKISTLSMPIKIHEYAICKKPVISAPLPEIKKTYGNSVLYASTAQEYAENVGKLISDKSLSLSLAENAYRIAEKHSWNALANAYEQVLMVFATHWVPTEC